jgi:hypothetical protein
VLTQEQLNTLRDALEHIQEAFDQESVGETAWAVVLEEVDRMKAMVDPLTQAWWDRY